MIYILFLSPFLIDLRVRRCRPFRMLLLALHFRPSNSVPRSLFLSAFAVALDCEMRPSFTDFFFPLFSFCLSFRFLLMIVIVIIFCCAKPSRHFLLCFSAVSLSSLTSRWINQSCAPSTALFLTVWLLSLLENEL